MTDSDDDDDADSITSVHSENEHDAQHHNRSSSQELSNGDDSDCTEVGNEERKSETAIELMLAACKMRKDLRAQKRQAKEAKAKALKSKPAPIVSFYLKLSTQHPITVGTAHKANHEKTAHGNTADIPHLHTSKESTCT